MLTIRVMSMLSFPLLALRENCNGVGGGGGETIKEGCGLLQCGIKSPFNPVTTSSDLPEIRIQSFNGFVKSAIFRKKYSSSKSKVTLKKSLLRCNVILPSR